MQAFTIITSHNQSTFEVDKRICTISQFNLYSISIEASIPVRFHIWRDLNDTIHLLFTVCCDFIYGTNRIVQNYTLRYHYAHNDNIKETTIFTFASGTF